MNERTLPHSLEAERSILGAILVNCEVFHTAVQIVSPQDFYRKAHEYIFQAYMALPSVAIDLVTVRDWLIKHGFIDEVGGSAYITALADGVPRSTNVESYAHIVRDYAILRGVILAGTRAINTAYEATETPSLVVDQTFADLLALSQRATGPGLQRVSGSLAATMAELEALSQPESTAWGHRTGLSALDRMLRGLRPEKMILVAGRPGSGKTSLALNIALAVAKNQKTVAVFSMEMATSELMMQLIASEARVNIEDLTDWKLKQTDWGRVSEAYSTVDMIPLYIDDHADLSPISLRAKARRLQIEHGLDLIVVDYVQLMQGLPTQRRQENEHERLTGISRALKLLAKDLKVPIVVCCQLNRAPETRGDGRPQLGDLRGSGAFEQDADVVLLIFRADMYPKKKTGLRRKTADVVNEEIEKGTAELIIAKQRGGKTGTVKVMFRSEWTRFENLAL